MRVIDPFIQEFKHEAEGTRKVLVACPDKDFGWKPHEKSMTLGHLAAHIADVPNWTGAILKETELNMEAGKHKQAEPKTAKELIEVFDKNCKGALEIMNTMKDQDMFVDWTFKVNGKLIFTMPRVAVLRSWVFSHCYHHRGQMTVYLRLRNVPVPGVYGPSADEQKF